VKAALIVADSVASAVVREGLDLKAWITETIHSERLTKSELVSQVIEQRKRNIETRTKKIFSERDFQLTVAQQPERSVVTAGCGTGKTLAGLLWCAEQLDRAEYGRVIFLYPTRGTATEGFRDYIGWAPDDEASLLHSSAEYELLAMLENPSDATDGKDYRESQQRLFALASYSRRYFSATVDQFLGFLAHDYGGLCRLPLLTDSVVVIDEVHSFDTKLLESLLQFLESFNIPVLCMTATLQPSRRKALEDQRMKVFPEPSDRASLVELESQESHPRYAIEWISDEIEALRIAKSAVVEGERVLWVVNSVNRCQQIAQQLAGLPTIVYHSRFKLGDRTHQHKLCVASFAFDAGAGGIIALTTQVCEMSLDLDADRLITECAPSEALIQRFGRANRHSGNRPSGFLAPVHVYKPSTEKPYDREDINGGAKLVDQAQFATVGGASQKQLADILLQCSPPGISPQPNARFFDSGIYAARGEFRDIDEYTVPCILDADLPVAQDLIKRKRPLDELIVPVPEFRAREPKPLWLPGYLRVALSSAYSPELGFTA
jgi:CRISPR-associated endonuclease/helicase Cas3